MVKRYADNLVTFNIAADSGENSDPRLMCTCKETACWGDTFRFLAFSYQIFDIQLDIRLIFGGGRLPASIPAGSMGGGNKRIIISAAVAGVYFDVNWQNICQPSWSLCTGGIASAGSTGVYYQPYWSFISSLRGWANTGSYCSWLIPSPCFLPPAHSFSIWRACFPPTQLNLHQNALHQSWITRVCTKWSSPARNWAKNGE